MAEDKKKTVKKSKKEMTAKERNKGVDMFAPGAGLVVHLPTSPEREFTAKAKMFEVESRLGKGCCTVLKKFNMPNGDQGLKGDTFDPVVERFSLGRFLSLVDRKFCTKAEDKVLAKMAKKQTPEDKVSVDTQT